MRCSGAPNADHWALTTESRTSQWVQCPVTVVGQTELDKHNYNFYFHFYFGQTAAAAKQAPTLRAATRRAARDYLRPTSASL